MKLVTLFCRFCLEFGLLFYAELRMHTVFNMYLISISILKFESFTTVNIPRIVRLEEDRVGHRLIDDGEARPSRIDP